MQKTKRKYGKNSKQKNIKQKGITLIALIITIIVLLILAGVTINTLFNNGNTMDKAGQAKEETSHGVVKDSIVLGLSNYNLDTLAPGGEKDKSAIDYLMDNGYITEKETYYKVEKKGRGDATLGKGQDKTTGDVYVIEKESEESENWELRYYKEKNEAKEKSRLLLVFTSNGSVTKDFEDEETDSYEELIKEAVSESKNPDGTLNKDTLKQKLEELKENKDIDSYIETPDGGIDVTIPDGTRYHIDKDGNVKKAEELTDEEYIGKKDSVYTKETRPKDYIPIYTREDLEQVGTGNNVVIEQEDNRECVYAIDANYILMDNIDLGGKDWTPIEKELTGVFEGNNKIINSMNINVTSEGNYGLFATSSATIQNLNMIYASINTTAESGSTKNIGIITGLQNGGQIVNCVVTGEINSETSATVGGMVGRIESKTSPINFTNVKAKVEINNNGNTGGIVGWYVANTYFKIENAINDGNITSNSSGTAGIVGHIDSNHTAPYDVKNCQNYGVIRGSGNVGGIVGYSYATIMANNCINAGDIITSNGIAGGIGGYISFQNNQVVFQNCKNYKNITGPNYLGGIAGEIYSSTTTNPNSSNNINITINENKGKIETIGSSAYNIGGIVGGMSVQYSATVTHNTNYGEINCGINGVIRDVSGIIGYCSFYSNNLNITVTQNTNEKTGKIICLADSASVEHIGGILGGTSGGTSNMNDNHINMTIASNNNNADIMIRCKTPSDYTRCSYISGISAYTDKSNCYSAANVNSGNIEIDNFNQVESVGGIIGSHNNSKKIEGCKNISNITINNSKNISYVGGIAGYLDSNSYVHSCCNTGNIRATLKDYSVSGSGAYAIGGVFGNCNCPEKIEKCYHVGSIMVPQNANGVGGIAGSVSTDSVISCYHEGDVITQEGDNLTSNNFGGIIGNASISQMQDCYSKGRIEAVAQVGGLIGNMTRVINIQTSYAMGNIKGDRFINGIVGYVSSSSSNTTNTIENTYFIGELETSNQSAYDICNPDNATITNSRKLTTEEATKQESYVGFDFENVWKMKEGKPELEFII